MADPRAPQVWSVSGVRFFVLPYVLVTVLAAWLLGLLIALYRQNVGIPVLATAFFATVLVLIVAGLEQSVREGRAESRLDTQGVETAAVVTKSGWEGDGSSVGPVWVVHYRYGVGGVEYRGTRDFTVESGTELPGIAPGSEVVIAVDPRDSRISGWLSPALSEYARRKGVFSTRT